MSRPRPYTVLRIAMLACGAARIANGQEFTPRPLSSFAVEKARTLLRERLPCLGCHQLDGEGGRLGPDLAVPSATPAAVVYAMIRDPQRTRPGSAMPKVPMPPETLELVASYLVARRGSRTGTVTVAAQSVGPRDTRALYLNFCAGCHGASGRGDGPNAKFLPVRPAAHADAATMSQRSDDMLFDAIAAGGYVLGRSSRMPGFGATLTSGEIRSLVGYIRELCRCAGPAWSR